MASSPITSWQIEGEKVETVTDFIFLGFKITVDSDCSQEIKRCLLLGRKAITNLESVFKHCFANKGLDSQSYGFSSSHVQMWSWTIKKAECWRVDAFKLWCWEKTPKLPWTARSNQSNLKEINPGRSLEGLKLKLQYSSHLMKRVNSWVKTLMLGKIAGRRRRGWQRMRWLDGIINSMDMSFSKLQRWWRTGKPGMLQSMGL